MSTMSINQDIISSFFKKHMAAHFNGAADMFANSVRKRSERRMYWTNDLAAMGPFSDKDG